LQALSSTCHVVALFTAVTVFKPGILSTVLQVMGGEAFGGLFVLLGPFEVIGRPFPEASGDGLLAFLKKLLAIGVRFCRSGSSTFNH